MEQNNQLISTNWLFNLNVASNSLYMVNRVDYFMHVKELEGLHRNKLVDEKTKYKLDMKPTIIKCSRVAPVNKHTIS